MWDMHRGYLWPMEAHLLKQFLQSEERAVYTVVSKEECDVPAFHLLSKALCLHRL